MSDAKIPHAQVERLCANRMSSGGCTCDAFRSIRELLDRRYVDPRYSVPTTIIVALREIVDTLRENYEATEDADVLSEIANTIEKIEKIAKHS